MTAFTGNPGPKESRTNVKYKNKERENGGREAKPFEMKSEYTLLLEA